MKNRRTVDSCASCQHAIHTGCFENYAMYCGVKGPPPEYPEEPECGWNEEYGKACDAVSKWFREHEVYEVNICDNFQKRKD